MSPPHKVVIIGGGPAGYTAAIYASRANLKPILYQGPQPGGQLTTTTQVENYPGYPDGIQGPQLMQTLQQQAQHFGSQIRTGTITAVNLEDKPYQLTIDNKETITTHTIIIATGSTPKTLQLPNERELYGRGISTCATCDGYFYRNQTVAVIGGGDSAAEEALYLANLCKKVHIIVRRNQMRASHIMQQRVKSKTNITIHWETETRQIHSKSKLEAITVHHKPTNTHKKITIQGLFVAIGHTPNTQLFKNHLHLDTHGYIKTKPKTTHTNLEGIYAAGDVQDHKYRQAVTAAATGCMAALDAERYLTTSLNP